MKTFVAIIAMLSVASADQLTHQSFKQGNAPAVQTTIHKPHHGAHALVSSQPSAQPSEVKQYHNEEKYASSAHAPVPKYANVQAPYAPKVTPYKPVLPYHGPVHKAPIHHALPIHHAAPVHPVHKPAPYVVPAPYVAPAPYHAPVAPAPYKPVVVPKPAYKPPHPSPYHEPAYEVPPQYTFGYEVADDYSGASFAANEDRNDYATSGSYRVALPDGRTQIVSYKVDDAYSGFIADVQYEGEAHYPEYQAPHHPAPYAPKPIHV